MSTLTIVGLLLMFVLQLTLISGCALLLGWYCRHQPAMRKLILQTGLVLTVLLPLLTVLGATGWTIPLAVLPSSHTEPFLGATPLPERPLYAAETPAVDFPPPTDERFANVSLPAHRSRGIDRLTWPLMIGLVTFAILGAVARLIGLARSWCRLRRMVRSAQIVELKPTIRRALLRQLPARFCFPELRVCDSIGSPAVVLAGAGTQQRRLAIPKYLIMMPTDVWQGCTDQQLEHVLLHECAHIVERDFQILRLQLAGDVLYWWHPLFRMLSHHVARVREEVCDNYALRCSPRASFGETLLAVAQRTQVRSSPIAISMLGSHPDLKKRILFLVDQRRSTMTSVSWIRRLAVIVPALALTLVLGLGKLTSAATTLPVDDITPGSVLNVSIRGVLETDESRGAPVPVQSGHRIILPLLPPVDVDGLTLEQIKTKVIELYRVARIDLSPEDVRIELSESRLTTAAQTPDSDAIDPKEPAAESPDELILDLRFGSNLEDALGNYYSRNYRLAESMFDELIKREPDNARLYFYRALNQSSLGEHQSAARDLSRAIELQPSFAEAYYHRGVTLQRMGDLDGADVDYLRVIELDAAIQHRALENLGRLAVARGRLDEAILHYNEALKQMPTVGRAWYLRGEAHRMMGQLEQAEADFRRALELGYPNQDEER